jgi:hypothetical protein
MYRIYGQEFNLRKNNLAVTLVLTFLDLEGHTADWVQRLQE